MENSAVTNYSCTLLLLHSFNGQYSWTAWVSQYQKVKLAPNRDDGDGSGGVWKSKRLGSSFAPKLINHHQHSNTYRYCYQVMELYPCGNVIVAYQFLPASILLPYLRNYHNMKLVSDFCVRL